MIICHLIILDVKYNLKFRKIFGTSPSLHYHCVELYKERSKSGDETGDKTGEEIGEEDNLDDDANLIKENLMKLEATMSSHCQ